MRQSKEKSSRYQEWERTHPLLGSFIWSFLPSLILTVVVHFVSKLKISYIPLTVALFDLITFVILTILIFGYYRFFGYQRRITVWWRLSGIGFGLLVGLALFLGTAIFTGSAPPGPCIKASLVTSLGTRQVRLYVGRYASNGEASPSLKGEGLRIKFSRPSYLPPIKDPADALLPFEAGILLSPAHEKTIDISSYKTIVLTLYCSGLDSISKLGFGIKSGRTPYYEVKYKMSLFKVEQSTESSGEILVYIPLNYYPRVIRKQAQLFNIFTKSLGEGGSLEFELRSIAFHEKI